MRLSRDRALASRPVINVGVLLAIMLACNTTACRSIFREEPPPPENVWMFVADGASESADYPRTEPRPDADVPPGILPMFYDRETRVVICGTYKRFRGPFIMPGYKDEEMVGYLRGADEVRGFAPFHKHQPGLWVRFTLLGTRAEDDRVKATMERRDARMTGTGRK